MSEISEEASNALRSVTRAEHAAIWVYGTATAFAEESRVSTAIEDALRTHEQQRGRAEQLLRSTGRRPPTAQPAYQVPEPVTDQNSAIRALIIAENDCQIGWRSVLDTTQDPATRKAALAGLTSSASRATRWRITIGQHPSVTAFPGDPS